MKVDRSVAKEKVTAYIKQAVHVDKEKIKESSLIFKEGFLDSMGLIVLISFLEGEFKIKTDDSDLIEENFESVNAITDFVIKKTGS